MKRFGVMAAIVALLVGAIAPVGVSAAQPTIHGFRLADLPVTRGATYEGVKSKSGKLVKSDLALIARTELEGRHGDGEVRRRRGRVL